MSKRKPFRILELFSGSRSLGVIAEGMGFEVCSVDWKPFPGTTIVADIRELKPADLPWRPSFTWASPDCTSFSICACSRHRKDLQPISPTAVMGDALARKTLELVDWSGGGYVIENPVGLLRKMPFMRGRDRRSVTYCTYGDRRMKPTDLWSNLYRDVMNPNGWEPRPACYNNRRGCHHDRQPRRWQDRKERGLQKLGTSGMRGSYERSKVPEQLVREVLINAHRMFLAGEGPWSNT